MTPSLTAEDLISAVPGLSKVADLETIQICNVPSPQISFRNLSSVVNEIHTLEKRGFDGVVITQGTDTIEETSWVLDLCCDASLAVIVTGAMRNPTQPGADGPAVRVRGI
ncbi:MAG: asparaginase domain-containing protein [Rhizobiaceae bacterium]